MNSAYHLDTELGENTKGECSCARQSNVWKQLWKMNVPNAMKVFMWWACNNALPTKANLIKMKIVINPLCPICELEPETMEHILWSIFCGVALSTIYALR